MYRIAHRALITLGVIACLALGCGLRQAQDRLKKELLERVPLGSDISDVRSLIQEEEWRVAYDDETRGFLDQRVRPPRTVGTKSIRAELGSYQGPPWRTFVTIFWGFDRDGKLIDVWVWKTHDTL
jgi:hypothetical protein